VSTSKDADLVSDIPGLSFSLLEPWHLTIQARARSINATRPPAIVILDCALGDTAWHLDY